MRRIYARDTTIVVIDREIADAFVEENHDQGSALSDRWSVHLGMFADGELVAVSQFCGPRTQRKRLEYTTEWLRLAFKKDVRVTGGASKMFKWFVSEYDPDDVFTYQATTGEATSVYEQCGMTLVSSDRTKQYVVAEGYDIDSAPKGKYWTMPYASRLGPDHLIGTSLGEVLDPSTGERKSNVRLFVEELGWHVETVSGDRVYEWRNPDRSYYTYRLTAEGSDSYYYGVHGLKIAQATEGQCLNDGYYGSGGVKLQNWVLSVGKESVRKEIVGIFDNKADAYTHEHALIGSSWTDDKEHCLNVRPGGIALPPSLMRLSTIESKECTVHGTTKHVGRTCCKCVAQDRWSLRECPSHGMSMFSGSSCSRCYTSDSWYVDECNTHGYGKHRSGVCQSCVNESILSLAECPEHGLVHHQGSNCCVCSSQASVVVKRCPIHGETKHQGDVCMKCNALMSWSIQECPVHGETLFCGGTCRRCSVLGSYTMMECPVHGETKHTTTGICKSCSNSSTVAIKSCPVHGEAKHQGEHCNLCLAQSAFSEQECPVHGSAKFRKGTCTRCRNMRTVHDRGSHEGSPREGCSMCALPDLVYFLDDGWDFMMAVRLCHAGISLERANEAYESDSENGASQLLASALAGRG